MSIRIPLLLSEKEIAWTRKRIHSKRPGVPEAERLLVMEAIARRRGIAVADPSDFFSTGDQRHFEIARRVQASERNSRSYRIENN